MIRVIFPQTERYFKMNYSETLEYIHSLGNFSKPAGLERMECLLSKLGSPEKELCALHIAGTNGKGSVSAMLAKIFENAGFKTGLFISPYIIDFRERIQINGEFIPETSLVKYAAKVKSAGVDVTEFEFITAAAFLYFRDMKCDIVIAETGLGGRLDATNTLKNVRAAVITRIGLDHTAVLGDTIEKIAYEKSGIIKDFPAVTSPFQPPEALGVIRRYAKTLFVPDKTQLKILKSDGKGNIFTYKGREYRTSLIGGYQVENAVTALEAVNAAGFELPYETVRRALSATYFPARMEIISESPFVLLDGAHNPDGAAALAEYLKNRSGEFTAIIGVMADKDYKEVLARTLPLCRAAVAVTVAGMPRSLTAERLCAAASQYCCAIPAECYDNAVMKALELADGGPLVVFGSLYLAAGMRDILKNLSRPR